MSLITIPGDGLFLPGVPWNWTGTSLASSNMLIDATGEKVAMCGRLFNKDRATKTINKVHFRFGTVVKAGGSVLRVSLQNLSTVSPIQPDETQDQFRDIANADAGFASNTWYSTGLITSDGTDTGTKRTVAYSEAIAAVIEFDAGGRLGADSINIQGFVVLGGNTHGLAAALKSAGAWAVQGRLPNVIFEFGDGTFGTLQGCLPCSTTASAGFKQDTAIADEYALEFQVPWPCKVDGAWAFIIPAADTSNFDVVLYDGITELASVAMVAGHAAAIGTSKMWCFGLPETQLDPNRTYRLGFRPSQTTSNITVFYIDVANAAHFQCHPGGAAFNYTTRLDAGAWAAPTLTRRLVAGIRISALSDTVGGVPLSRVFTGF